MLIDWLVALDHVRIAAEHIVAVTPTLSFESAPGENFSMLLEPLSDPPPPGECTLGPTDICCS